MAGDTTSQNAIWHKARQNYPDLKVKTIGSSSEVDNDFKGSKSQCH